MHEILACCGLHCHTCPVYLATRVSDPIEQDKMRAGIARLCNEQYGMNYTPEDITGCDGCSIINGQLFSGCRDCQIRKCVSAKGIENCAYCNEFICDQLDEIFTFEPEARERLEALREHIQTPDNSILL